MSLQEICRVAWRQQLANKLAGIYPANPNLLLKWTDIPDTMKRAAAAAIQGSFPTQVLPMQDLISRFQT